MRQETNGVLLESYLIYEPEHVAFWFKDGKALLGALDFEEKYQGRKQKKKKIPSFAYLFIMKQIM